MKASTFLVGSKHGLVHEHKKLGNINGIEVYWGVCGRGLKADGNCNP